MKKIASILVISFSTIATVNGKKIQSKPYALKVVKGSERNKAQQQALALHGLGLNQ